MRNELQGGCKIHGPIPSALKGACIGCKNEEAIRVAAARVNSLDRARQAAEKAQREQLECQRIDREFPTRTADGKVLCHRLWDPTIPTITGRLLGGAIVYGELYARVQGGLGVTLFPWGELAESAVGQEIAIKLSRSGRIAFEVAVGPDGNTLGW